MDHSRAPSLRSGPASDQVDVGEVDRLQEQLDQLRVRIATAGRRGAPDDFNGEQVRLVREITRARRRRDAAFGHKLFGEPAWDILLELYLSELTHRKMSVSDACLASGVPLTTALRWVGTLAKEGWISRKSDPFDGRRVFVSLTQQGLSAMRTYLSEVRLEATD